MNFHVVTLFAGAVEAYLNESILGRAKGDKKIKVSYYNPRDFSKPLRDGKRAGYIDGKPYGGGPGMVLEAEPIIKSIDSALKKDKKSKVIILSPSGKELTNAYAKNLVKKYKSLILVSGRYEGIDSRVKKIFKAEEVSIGPYVLTGGEAAASVFIDVVSRQIKGVLQNKDSLEENRVSTSEVYTRPEEITYKGKKFKVPKVLLSGNHKKINAWKLRSKKLHNRK